MGSKNNPGKFDCYKSLKPDEPHFVIKGKDVIGAELTELWAYVRGGRLLDFERTVSKLRNITKDNLVSSSKVNFEKILEALSCSRDMSAYREQRAGRRKLSGHYADGDRWDRDVIARNQILLAALTGQQVLIWCGERQAYYGKDCCGYQDYDQAGVYDFEFAMYATENLGPEKKIQIELVL